MEYRQQILPSRIYGKKHIRRERAGWRTGLVSWSDMQFAANSGLHYSLPDGVREISIHCCALILLCKVVLEYWSWPESSN